MEIFDTTLRDGTQGEHITLSAQDKIQIAHQLDDIGIDIIEGGWPGSNPKDKLFFELAQKENFKHAKICAFGSTRRPENEPKDDPNLKALLEANTAVISIFGKSWTLHAKVALGITLNENINVIRSSVLYLVRHGKRVIYDAEHFFDGYKDNPMYALSTLRAAASAGADTLVLCDTNGGTMPSEIKTIVQEVVKQFPRKKIGIHTHNDCGCAVANTIMAVEGGATHIQGTINGIGERCGNADLTTVIPALEAKMEITCLGGMLSLSKCKHLASDNPLSKLTDLSKFVNEIANLDPIDRAPFVGRSAFAHKGGIHVSAVIKDPRMYEHMKPELVGNRRRVLVSDLSGQSNVKYKAKELGIPLGNEAKEAVNRIKELENLGYEFQGAEASFELLLRTIKGENTDFFKLERFHVDSQKSKDKDDCHQATIVMNVAGRRVIVATEGEGPVDALSLALRKSLIDSFPQLADMNLSDYKVRVLTPERATAAQVRVLIEHTSHHESTQGKKWHTVGVSTNILEASWQALADGVRYFLLKTTPAEVPVEVLN